MSPEWLIVAALATYRLTLLLSREHGPAEIFARFRYVLGVRPDEYSKETATGFWSELILCPYCLSVWIGFLITVFIAAALYFQFETIAFFVLLPFALSGLSVFFYKWAGV